MKIQGRIRMRKMNWLRVCGKAPVCGMLLAVLVFSAIFQGCGVEETDSRKLKDLSYTIVEEKDIPQEFLSVIEEKKKENFKLTYTDKEHLYIAVGYGTQETSGYSISVNDCYLTRNAIYFDTTLIGPSKGEKINQVKSFPYIVVQTKYSEKSVVFD